MAARCTAHRAIFCCGCGERVGARLTTGEEIYPHRPDLDDKRFWRCDRCQNYVGCHGDSQRPLGNIPTPELRNARRHIHAILDPIWKSKKMGRSQLYRLLSDELGYTYHTAELRTLEEARRVYRIVRKLADTAG